MNRKPVIIGVVGGPSTGKGEIANLLQEHGFVAYSLSDALRARATASGLSHDRQVLTEIANNLRAKSGPGALAVEAKMMLEDSGHDKIVVESIRHPEEVVVLQRNMNAFVIGVTMPSLEKRFALMRIRNRPGDPKTWDEFLSLVESEEGGRGKDTDIQIGRALEASNVVIENNGTVEQLREQVMELLRPRGIEFESRPPVKERR
jgi:dephospho-CoA kinase